MTELAKGTQIPAETIDEIYAWYQFRRVCDNERFQAYFNRELKLLERQYLLLLRSDMTTWDPMVSDYMERQIQADEQGTSKMTVSGSKTGKQTGTKKNDKGGSDTIESESDSHATRTLDTQQDTTGHGALSGTDTVTSNSTREDDLTRKRDENTTRTDDLTSSSKTDRMDNEISDAKTLAGSTPDSSTYGTGGSIGLKAPAEGMPEVLHEIGAPDKLDWKYTSQQSEAVGTSDKVGREVATSTDSGTVTTEGGSTETDSGTVTMNGESATKYGRTSDDTQKVEQTGTIKDATGSTGSVVTKYGSESTDTIDMADSQTSNEEQAGESGKTLDHKERYSGRHEAPPDLLQKAQSYIMNSNSLKWLIRNLEPVFFQVYESW